MNWQDGTPKSTHNVFNWHGKSTIPDAMGRIKTERQILLDATRVNKEDHVCTTYILNSVKAPR